MNKNKIVYIKTCKSTLQNHYNNNVTTDCIENELFKG